MANELTLNTSINYTKGGAIVTRTVNNYQVTISGTAVTQGVQSIPTADTTLSIVAAPGYVYVKNLDATNYVQVGPDATNWFIKLLAGQHALFPINGTALHAKANTGACNLEFIVFSL
jgi:hypothetical protein